MLNQILLGDSIEVLRTLPESSVHCCVTSPPYFGLRDYGVAGQIGLEKTVEAYIEKLVEVFREVGRVLRSDGTVWLNLGDSYSSGHKPKNLLGVPWRVAFALQADGWYLRSDIIWHKPNPMPESVLDRPTRSHEYIFLLSKSAKYWYDAKAIMEERKVSENRPDAIERQRTRDYNVKYGPNGSMKTVGSSTLTGGDYGRHHLGDAIPEKERRKKPDKQRGHSRRHAGFNDRWDQMSREEQQSKGANKRDVWTVATQPFKEAHYATFPPTLIVPCIKAGCPIDGIVLDPFIGSGTTGLVARRLQRNFVGIELNPKNAEMARNRILKSEGFFAE